jgi:hypothetical protein
MDIPDYPPNSEASRRKTEEKDIKRVTSDEPIRRKKPLRKKFSETFVAGDAKSAVRYVMFDVLIPAARDMIAEAGSQGIEKWMFGDSRRRGPTPPQAGPTGYVTYNRPIHRMGGSPQRAMSRQARARHDFDEIVLPERVDAERVIDELFEVISRYGEVSVADLYEMVGVRSAHTDNKWGWTDLRGSGISRVRGGFLLDLPQPEPLD